MGVTLSPETEELIRARMQHGGYSNEDAVVRAALDPLKQNESQGDFEPGELDALLEEAERSGEPLDAEQVFAELRQLRARYRQRS